MSGNAAKRQESNAKSIEAARAADPPSLSQAYAEDSMSRESGLALIEDAQRWESAYRRERDALAELREIAKRDYLRMLGMDRTFDTLRSDLAINKEEVERLIQVLGDLRDEVIDAATHSTDSLMRERLLAAAERAK